MELNQEEIKEQAKKIIDKFVSEIEKIEIKEEFVERKEDRREEKEPLETDKEFRRIMFENSPEERNDCIVAEKGKWVK
ncbi:MAG: hypothetical protein QXF25_00240 [Candidatus Pacearchaeota archaeon]